jgi:hypothetical protein
VKKYEVFVGITLSSQHERHIIINHVQEFESKEIAMLIHHIWWILLLLAA